MSTWMVTKPHAGAPMSLRARTVFEDLGYEVVSDGGEIEARRDNKHVEVVPVSDPSEVENTDTRYDKLCFVAEEADVGEVESELGSIDGVETAVISLEGAEYSVVRSP